MAEWVASAVAGSLRNNDGRHLARSLTRMEGSEAWILPKSHVLRNQSTPSTIEPWRFQRPSKDLERHQYRDTADY
jgi:hypothetical protein